VYWTVTDIPLVRAQNDYMHVCFTECMLKDRPLGNELGF
jgi:hypothetical protein